MTGNWNQFQQDTDGNGSWELDQARTHDKANEISQIAGSTSHVAHDRAGNMTRASNPNGYTLRFEYDPNNQVTKATPPSGIVTTYTRNSLGQVTQVSNPNVTYTSCLDSGHIQRIAPHLLFRIPFLMPFAGGNAARRILQAEP